MAATVKAPPHRVVWEPTPKQAEFLACNDYEVLYGGAAGGGKSDAMLIEATGAAYGGPGNAHFRAVIFRKTFPDLRDLIDRARELYPQFMPGITYNKVDHTFTTPQGAKIEFAYLANDDDRLKYRGRAWNFIGFEELTLWATSRCYEYLKSRCRTTDRALVPHCYVRATTNPDGPGQLWVMKHWGIGEDGQGTVIDTAQEFEEVLPDDSVRHVMRQVRRRFIPARLADNRFLLGTGYRERLLVLPPDDREALLHGRWTGNRVRGAYYLLEMQRARAEGRLRNVPHVAGVPVNTFWDLGWNDTTAIVFHQRVHLEDRFPLAFQQSGEAIPYYAAFLQRCSAERGFVYGTHYLPHDADHKSLQTGKSVRDLLEGALPGHRFVVVPRVEHLLTGIQQTRVAFGGCWFDVEECADLIAALDAYRKKWDPRLEVFTDEAVHDGFSNYADAFRQFGQGYIAPRLAGDAARRPSRSSTWKSA